MLVCCSVHMAISDVAGGRVYHVADILREFLGQKNLSPVFVQLNLKTKKTFKTLKPDSMHVLLRPPDVFRKAFGPMCYHCADTGGRKIMGVICRGKL